MVAPHQRRIALDQIDRKNSRKCAIVERRIGARVRASRILAGLTQEDLAEYIGVSVQQVQKYESGTNRLSVSTAIRVCSLFRCTLEDLVSVPKADTEHGGRKNLSELAADDLMLAEKISRLRAPIRKHIVSLIDTLIS